MLMYNIVSPTPSRKRLPLVRSPTPSPSPLHFPLNGSRFHIATPTAPLGSAGGGSSSLIPRAFQNKPPPLPLFKRKSYKATSAVLFVVALIFFAFSTSSAVLMLLAVLLSLVGSYSTRNRKVKVAGSTTAAGVMSAMFSGGPSLAVLGTTGPALIIYLGAFLSALPAAISSATTTAGGGNPYYNY